MNQYPSQALSPFMAHQAAVASGLNKQDEVDEINRITSLPIVHPMAPEVVEYYSQNEILASAYQAGARLLVKQAEGLMAYDMAAGGLFQIGVGKGKTLLSLMLAQRMLMVKGLERAILCIPSHVWSQLIEVDIPWARSRVPLSCPMHLLGGRAPDMRKQIVRAKRRGLYILPYSLLSQPDASDMLDAIDPHALIADEAHRLRNASAARTKRITRLLRERERMEFVAMSGTLTTKSIKDYSHLSKAALKGNNFLPNISALADGWGAVIDAGADQDRLDQSNPGPIMPIVRWAQVFFPRERARLSPDVSGFRHAFKLRKDSTPGVVSGGDGSDDIGVSLIIANSPVEGFKKGQTPYSSPEWDYLKELIRKVEEEWVTPNGDEIDHAMLTWKWLWELCSGFYNQLTWPTVEALSARRGLELKAAHDLLQASLLHHASEQEYAKELREFIKNHHQPGLDTPMLVGKNISQHNDRYVGQALASLWKRTKSLDFPGRVVRDKSVVRVCPFKVDHAVKWATTHVAEDEGAILWYYHQEVGEWLSDLLGTTSVPFLHCPAGKQHDLAIAAPENARKKIVASISAHGEGKNLQHFQHQLFVQFPRGSSVAEQAIGRTHRTGQKADELVVHTMNTLSFDALNFAACLNDALYAHQTGSRMKMIYANYDPLPKVFPSALLAERGFDPKIWHKDQDKMLAEKFGSGSSPEKS